MMESFTPEEERQHADRSKRMMTRLLMFAIVMFFAGLTSAYVVMRNGSDFWVRFRLPNVFYWSTGAIILGSVTVQLALVFSRRGASRILVSALLALTFLFGVVFARLQFKGWGELYYEWGQVLSASNVLQPAGEYGVDYVALRGDELLDRIGGQYFAPTDAEHAYPLNSEMAEETNQASQFFYVLTGAHLAHLAFGLFSVLLMIVKAVRGRYTPTTTTGLWAGATYWHFLGGLWIYLLLFLHFVH